LKIPKKHRGLHKTPSRATRDPPVWDGIRTTATWTTATRTIAT